MYRLDKLLDLTPLKGKEVEQVAIGQYQVILNLTDDFSIYIGGSYKYGKGDALVENNGQDPSSSKELVDLLGKEIINSYIESDRILSMHFSNDCILELIDDSDQYESFTITGESFEIIA